MTRFGRIALVAVLAFGLSFPLVRIISLSDPQRIHGLFGTDRAAFIIITEFVLGFALTVSALDWHWALHGATVGLVFSLPLVTWLVRVYDGNYATALSVMALNAAFGALVRLLLSRIPTKSFRELIRESRRRRST